jgi:hypothetical protein
MDENEAQEKEKTDAGSGKYTVVTLSDAQAQKVMEFIAELKSDEDDVGGYAFTSGLFGGVIAGSRAAAGTITNTDATVYWTGEGAKGHWDSTLGDFDPTT